MGGDTQSYDVALPLIIHSFDADTLQEYGPSTKTTAARHDALPCITTNAAV